MRHIDLEEFCAFRRAGLTWLLIRDLVPTERPPLWSHRAHWLAGG